MLGYTFFDDYDIVVTELCKYLNNRKAIGDKVLDDTLMYGYLTKAQGDEIIALIKETMNESIARLDAMSDDLDEIKDTLAKE